MYFFCVLFYVCPARTLSEYNHYPVTVILPIFLNLHFLRKHGIIQIMYVTNNWNAIIGRKENTMEYFFVTECIGIGLMHIVFNVRIMNSEHNLVGNANVIVNEELKCNSEFESYNESDLPGFVKTEAEMRCIERAKFIF